MGAALGEVEVGEPGLQGGGQGQGQQQEATSMWRLAYWEVVQMVLAAGGEVVEPGGDEGE